MSGAAHIAARVLISPLRVVMPSLLLCLAALLLLPGCNDGPAGPADAGDAGVVDQSFVEGPSTNPVVDLPPPPETWWPYDAGLAEGGPAADAPCR